MPHSKFFFQIFHKYGKSGKSSSIQYFNNLLYQSERQLDENASRWRSQKSLPLASSTGRQPVCGDCLLSERNLGAFDQHCHWHHSPTTTPTTTHTHTHPFNSRLSGTTRWAGTRKVKPIWILLKQETVSGSGIRWAICKSAPRSSHTTMPAPSIIRPANKHYYPYHRSQMLATANDGMV